MTDLVEVAFITTVGAGIVATVGAVAAIIAAKMGKKNAAALQEVKISIDGRLEQLIQASHQRGQIAERDNQRAIEEHQSAAEGQIALGRVLEQAKDSIGE